MRNVARDIGRTLGAQGVIMIALFASGVLTARVLGPDDRGLYSLCLAIARFSVVLGAFEIGQSTVYHAARKRLSFSEVFGANLSLAVILGLITGAALFASLPLVQRVFDELPLDSLRTTAVFVALTIIGSALREIFRSFDRFDLYNGIRVFDPLLKLAALTATFLYGGGILEALQALALATGLSIGVTLLLLLRLGIPSLKDGFAHWGSFLRFGGRLEATSMVAQIHLRVTIFLIAYYLEPADVAYFAICEALVLRLLTVPNAVGAVILPKIAVVDDQEAASITAKANRNTVLLMVVVVVTFALVTPYVIVLLYGEVYAPAILPMFILLPMALFRSVSRVLTRYLVVANQVRKIFFLNLIGLAVHMALLVVLVPRYGVLGAAASATGTYFIHSLCCVLFFRSATGLPSRSLLIATGQDVARLTSIVRRRLGRT